MFNNINDNNNFLYNSGLEKQENINTNTISNTISNTTNTNTTNTNTTKKDKR